MGSEKKILSGTLSLRSNKKGNFSKSKTKKYQGQLFGNSQFGIARLELYENEKVLSPTYSELILGSDVIKVQQLTNDFKDSFLVATKGPQYTFTAHDKQCDAWVEALQHTLILSQQTQALAGPAAPSTETPDKLTVDNDIYVTTEELNRVFPVESDVQNKAKLAVTGPVSLVVESGTITINSLEGNRLARWAIETLRRFGYTDSNFHVECGRNSGLGPGYFYFNTHLGKNIYNLVTEEKSLCRKRCSSDPRHSMMPRLGPGYSLPALQQPASDLVFTNGGHLYEELPPFNFTGAEHQALTPSLSSLDISERKVSPHQNAMKHSYMSPPIASHIKSLPAVKSQPTHSKDHHVPPGMPCRDMLRPAANFIPPPPPTKAPQNCNYSEPIVHKEAWRSNGRDVEDDYGEVNNEDEYETYDKLSHLTKPNNDQNHYGLVASCLEGARQGQPTQVNQAGRGKQLGPPTPLASFKPQVDSKPQTESIYAVVDKSKKSKNNN